MRVGTVYLVGAGPGDPGLITVKGRQLLERAEVVVYDHLVSPRLLKACAAHATLIYVGKEASRHTASQAAINQRLIREARAGKRVVRLKGGDPFVFGRGGEEALALAKAKVPYEIVPGVTSAIAVPAYAGIPVTHRRLASSVAIITGHEDPTKEDTAVRWDRLSTGCDTLVFLMGVSTLSQIVTKLMRHGRRGSTPCAVIERGSLSQQRTVTGTLTTIIRRTQRAHIVPPAILVVGEVVRLRRSIRWFERKPLFGQRILVTRAADHAGSLSEQLEALGADVEELPAIELASVKHHGALRQTLHERPKADWVFFTSPEGLGWFSRALKPYRKDLRWLSGCHLGAIGPKTAAALETAGLHVDFIPRRFSQEGVLADFPSRVMEGKRALIFSAEGSRDVLEHGLRKRGMKVTKVAIYRTALPKDFLDRVTTVLSRPFDAVTVTSSSCVEHLWQALRRAGKPARFRQLRFVSIGPVTSHTVRAHGGRVAIEAKVSTIEGLVGAFIRRRHR